MFARKTSSAPRLAAKLQSRTHERNVAANFDTVGLDEEQLYVAKATKNPNRLEPEKVRALLSQLDWCFRVMVLLDAATGLRRGELLALKRGGIEVDNLQIRVQHLVYMNVVGGCKTEASKDLCPWIQYPPPNFGPGNSAALTVNQRIGCSRTLAPRARLPIGRISYFLELSVLLRRVPEFKSDSAVEKPTWLSGRRSTVQQLCKNPTFSFRSGYF